MIRKDSLYFKQAELLVRVLPWVAKCDCFALKGGTAINLFVEDMPRLSVDIDLTYVPVQERDESLKNIENALKKISHDVEKNVLGAAVREIKIPNPSMVAKLHIAKDDVLIKIEPNLVIRGTVFSCQEREISKKAQELFDASARIKVVSLADLYGGKICAALDRQHPRDLFDVRLLWDGDGFSDEVRKAFLVYLISHDRPMHEVLRPKLKDIREVYLTDFQDMADDAISCEELVEFQNIFPAEIRKALRREEKLFLLSLKQGHPNWSLLGIAGVESLPAVRWKLFNIQKMHKEKRSEFAARLESVLEM